MTHDPSPTPTPTMYHRRVIRVRAEDSPNVALALRQVARGEEPSGETLVPGMLDYPEYKRRRALWDKIRQCVGLDALFYDGAEVRMYPDAWLLHSEMLWHKYRGVRRLGKGLGCDPAEGGDSTSYSAVDDLGLLELVSKKTPNTSLIVGETMGLARAWGIDPKRIYFDRGGGGKQHADNLVAAGYDVKSIGFGEAVIMEPKRGVTTFRERVDSKGDQYAFVNRRAEMYWELRLHMDPEGPHGGFAIAPASEGPQYAELRRQMEVFPVLYDGEGRIRLPPKRHLAKTTSVNREQSLEEMLGCSPDETDSLVLAVHAKVAKQVRSKAGVIG